MPSCTADEQPSGPGGAGPTGADAVGPMPFATLIGLEMISVSSQSVIARLPWSPARCTAGGVMHGGAIMALADTTGAVLAARNLREGTTTTTLSSATQFVRGLRGGAATATSRLLHRGRTTIVAETDVTDDDGRLLARVTQTQAVLDRT